MPSADLEQGGGPAPGTPALLLHSLTSLAPVRDLRQDLRARRDVLTLAEQSVVLLDCAETELPLVLER